jgi:hypothetical protein
MRILSYILMAVGILLLASAGYDECRGITHEPSKYGGRYSIVASGWSHEIIRKKTNPDNFHNAMVCHWVQASILLFAGFILFQIVKGQERVDPLSPDYAGNKALDEWSDAMKKEEERRKHPEP